MAFMMPVVKKDWEIYPNKPVRSRKSSTCSNPGKGMSSNKSHTDMFSTSPKSISEYAPPSVRAYQRSESTDSTESNGDPIPPIPKSASSMSFTNFHTRLVEKIRRKISKSSREDEENESETATDAAARSST